MKQQPSKNNHKAKAFSGLVMTDQLIRAAFTLAVLLVAAFMISGADAQSVTPGPTDFRIDDRTRIVMADNDLATSLTVANPRFRRRGIFTQFQIEFKSQRNDPLAIEYQVRWFSEDGFEISGPSVAWTVANLSPGQPGTVTSTGRDRDAYAVMVTFKYAKA